MKKSKDQSQFLGNCDGKAAKFGDLSKFANEFIPTQHSKTQKQNTSNNKAEIQQQNTTSSQLAANSRHGYGAHGYGGL